MKYIFKFISYFVTKKIGIYRFVKLRSNFLMNNFEYLDSNDISTIIHDIISEYRYGTSFDFYKFAVNVLKDGVNIDDDTVYDILVFLSSFAQFVGYDYYDSYKDVEVVFDILYNNNIKISLTALEKFMDSIYKDPCDYRLIDYCYEYDLYKERYIYLRDNYFKAKIDMVIDSGTLEEKLKILKARRLPYDIRKSLFDSIIEGYSDKEKLLFLSNVLKNYSIDVTYLIDLYVKEGLIDDVSSVIRNNIKGKEYTEDDIVGYVSFLITSNDINNDNVDAVLDNSGMRDILMSYYDTIELFIYHYIDPKSMKDTYNRAVYLKKTLFGDDEYNRDKFSGRILKVNDNEEKS